MNNIGAETDQKLDGTGAQGQRVDGGGITKEYIYCSETKSKGEVCVITYDGDEETNPAATDAATSNTYQRIGVFPEAVTAAGFAWVVTRGPVNALVEGTTDVAKDDFLEVLNGETSFKKDSATRSTNSAAIACAAQADNSSVLTKVWLTGERVIVAAS